MTNLIEEKNLTTEKELEWLFIHMGNVELFSDIKRMVIIHGGIKNLTLKEGISTDDATNLTALRLLNDIIFPVLQGVYLFNSEQFKCVEWIRGILRKYETKFSEFIKGLILSGLNDKKRFQQDTGSLTFIRNEICHINCQELQKEEGYAFNPGRFLPYFLGNDFSYPFEKFAESFLRIRGILKTDDDIFQNFIKQNWNKAIEWASSLNSLTDNGLERRNVTSGGMENFFCKGMPIDFVENHFKVFTELKNEHNEPFLTMDELRSFINRGVYNQSEIPQQTIRYGKRMRGAVQYHFYIFFYEASKIFENTDQCSDKYIRLLTDNFTGWNFETVKNNWSHKPTKPIQTLFN